MRQRNIYPWLQDGKDHNMLDSTSKALMPEPSAEFADESARLEVLADFQSDALEDDAELQAIVNFAAKLCNAPASMVSLLDDKRQYFLARTGIEQRETPRDIAFCAHALGRSDVLEVEDATKDPRFAENPLVTGAPGIRYYAGQPLVSVEGAPLGTLCVVDTQAHAPLNDFQREGMAVLAQAAMRRLRARRASIIASREIAEGEQRFEALADSMPDIAFSADEDGTFDYFNRRWQEFTGIDGLFDAEIGRQVLHPDEYDTIMQHWADCIASGEPYEFENRLRRAEGQWRWVIVRALPVQVGETGRTRWFGTVTDIHDAHELSETRDMLAKELSHRIKNIFAVISGLISLEARKEPEHADFADRLTQVLQALGRAHDFVRPSGGTARENLQGLLQVIFAPYRDRAGKPRVTVSGDDAEVSHKAATPLALVFNELATNSAKYGALSVEGGHVSLVIENDGERVHLLWKEHGGPQVVATEETGFGSRMVQLAVTGQLQGNWDRQFQPDGLLAKLDFPAGAIAP